MDQFKEDQLVMCVVDYLAEKASVVAESPMAAEQAAEVTTLYEKVDGARGGPAQRTKKPTAAAITAQKQLLDRPLYDGYLQARKIITCGGKEKPAAA